MAIMEKGGYGSIKDSGGRASGNWKGMSGINGSGGMKGMEENRKPHRHIRSFQVIILGFALLILAGSLILMLPWATRDGRGASFADALFTATSAACVTGLVVQDTATYWSGFGQAVILLLIQIGGIGLIALASIIFISLNKKISLKNRRMIQESYNLEQMSGLVTVVRKVVLCVFAAEGIGAVGYAFCFVPEFGLVKGLGQAVFTAVSAFCNAGIDLLGENSLADYVTNPLVNVTTMGLIIASGLGFNVWWDLGERIKLVFQKKLSPGRLFRTLRLQSKLVLTTTGILLLGGTICILLFEYKNPDTLGSLSFGQKLMAAAFQSVTTRTAGFFTVDQGALTSGSVMMVGGSPMGTAGGVKTTTLAVLVMSIIANLRGKKDVEVYGRKIRSSYIRSAQVVVGMAVSVLLISVLGIFAIMPDAPFVDVLYELTSAIGTVGLSRGLTAVLNTPAKWIVIFTMYLGRIGPLTLGAAVVSRAQKRTKDVHLAEENIMIG